MYERGISILFLLSGVVQSSFVTPCTKDSYVYAHI